MNDTDKFSTQEILAKTIWGESRGESYEGQQAVASVIINRVNHGGWWGDSVRSVCLKPYQFSCWLKQDPNRIKMLEVDIDDNIYVQCLGIAAMAINDSLFDNTFGCDSYYAINSPVPKWSLKLTPIVTIGHHMFFKTV